MKRKEIIAISIFLVFTLFTLAFVVVGGSGKEVGEIDKEYVLVSEINVSSDISLSEICINQTHTEYSTETSCGKYKNVNYKNGTKLKNCTEYETIVHSKVVHVCKKIEKDKRVFINGKEFIDRKKNVGCSVIKDSILCDDCLDGNCNGKVDLPEESYCIISKEGEIKCYGDNAEWIRRRIQ